MKKQLSLLGIILASSVTLGGCAFGTAQSKLNGVATDLLRANSFHVVADITQGSTNAGQGEQKTHFDGTLDLRTATNIKADGTLTTQGATIEPAMNAHIIVTDAVYIQFQSLNYPGSPFTITPTVQNTFYKVASENLSDLLPGGSVAAQQDRLSEDQKKQIRDAIHKAKFFTLVEKKGTEKIGGKRASHYTVKLNGPELTQLSDTINAIAGTTSDPASKQSLQKQIDALSATPFDVWLSQFGGHLLQVSFAFTTGSDRTSGTFVFDQFNDKKEITTPTNTKPFDQLFTDLGSNIKENLGPSVDLNATIDPDALKSLQAELDKITR